MQSNFSPALSKSQYLKLQLVPKILSQSPLQTILCCPDSLHAWRLVIRTRLVTLAVQYVAPHQALV